MSSTHMLQICISVMSKDIYSIVRHSNTSTTHSLNVFVFKHRPATEPAHMHVNAHLCVSVSR